VITEQIPTHNLLLSFYLFMSDYFKRFAENSHQSKSQKHLASMKWHHIKKIALRYPSLPQAINWLLLYVSTIGFDLLTWLQTLLLKRVTSIQILHA